MPWRATVPDPGSDGTFPNSTRILEASESSSPDGVAPVTVTGAEPPSSRLSSVPDPEASTSHRPDAVWW